jgi:hypothetical protein
VGIVSEAYEVQLDLGVAMFAGPEIEWRAVDLID